MASIFPGSASVGQIFEGYLFNGTAWDLIGNEFNPTTFSPTAPDNPKAGDLWVDSDSDVPSISNETILTINSASATYLTKTSASTTYATKAELSNIDALPSQSGNTGKYLTTNGSAASWSTIDLTSAINTASAAAVTYLVDSAPATLDTLNELAAALGDDANFASTVTTSLGNKLDISSASTTYLSKNEASSTYLTSASMQTVPVYVMNSGSSAQRPVSPTAGMFRFNTTSGYPEWYDPNTSSWLNFYQGRSTTIEYLVIAGGGGGAGAGYRNTRGGGGGAGGYLTGTGTLAINTSYLVTVGAGGAAGNAGLSSNASSGLNSVFSTLTAVGGGAGGAYDSFASEPGGSGGGGGSSSPGENGNVDGSGFGGDGGSGTVSTITGFSVTRAGGGGGGGGSGTGGAGSGGGGNGAGSGVGGVGGDATANTGSGGGGGNSIGEPNLAFAGGTGGSGVVILSYPSYYTINIGAGLAGTTTPVGENKVTTFTSGTGTVTFN